MLKCKLCKQTKFAMRTFLFLIYSFLILTAAIAQKPEPIYGFARVQKSIPWYKEQALAWKKEVDNNPKDANAWYNYYRVTKNLIGCDTTDTRPRHVRWEELGKIVKSMALEVPNSYEYNLCKFSIEGNNFEYLSYLLKADELSNGRNLHLDFMVNWGEIDRNLERRDLYCKKWYESGEISPGLLFYNYNVISGTKPNAILFTSGDNDTYPIWLLQSQGVRRDITVLNFSLLQIDSYRDKVFKELGISPYVIPKSKTNKDSNMLMQQKFEKEIIKHVTKNKKNLPVYLAVSACGTGYIEPIEENLFLTGLTYEYSAEPLDNIAQLKRNFEQNYALDYIDKAFFPDISKEKVIECSRNYIIPMLKLYNHYKEAGDLQHANWIKQKLLLVSAGSKDEREVKKQIGSF